MYIFTTDEQDALNAAVSLRCNATKQITRYRRMCRRMHYKGTATGAYKRSSRNSVSCGSLSCRSVGGLSFHCRCYDRTSNRRD